MDLPRIIEPGGAFVAIIDWIHHNVVKERKAPGAIIGLSGTDSLVVFLATYHAFQREGRGDRVWGVHFSPSADFLYDHPEAEPHLWFGDLVMPWLAKHCPKAKLTVDTSIDWRMDGVRWGMLSEMGAVSYEHGRQMRAHDERYWLIGTRNRTEEVLFTYSNASLQAGFQPLVHLWKSEVLAISKRLNVPEVAIAKSCDVDCICGRQRLPAHHIREVDLLLMARVGELDKGFLECIDSELGAALSTYVHTQIRRSSFKAEIPYTSTAMLSLGRDPLVHNFDTLQLDLRTFNHQKHVEVAWRYLEAMPFEEALARYCDRLQRLLKAAGVERKYSADITRSYFEKIDADMKRGDKMRADLQDSL